MPDTISSLTLLDGKTYGLRDSTAEKTANRVESITNQSTNNNYPTAKAVWDLFESKVPTSISMTIPTTGWSQDNTAVYSYYYDYAVQGITADNRAEVTLSVSSLQTAADCGVCPTNETIAGYIRLRAMSVPTASMAAVALIS